MRGTDSHRAAVLPPLVRCRGARWLMALSACGTSIASGARRALEREEAATSSQRIPLARPIQVAWTSARAKYCGFLFDPARLRANYLAAEARQGNPQNEMQKIEKAYDYTFESVLDGIRDDPSYCSKARTDAIRGDLNRYLAGDYDRPRARASVARVGLALAASEARRRRRAAPCGAGGASPGRGGASRGSA